LSFGIFYLCNSQEDVNKNLQKLKAYYIGA
jgi:hypothetical protein